MSILHVRILTEEEAQKIDNGGGHVVASDNGALGIQIIGRFHLHRNTAIAVDVENSDRKTMFVMAKMREIVQENENLDGTIEIEELKVPAS